MGDGRILPRDCANDDHTHEEIKYGDEKYRQDDGARDVSCRILNLSPEIGDVVVAAVVIHGDQGCAREPVKEWFGKLKCTRRKIERHATIEMNEAGTDHPEHRSEDDGQHNHRETSNGFDRPIEQESNQQADESG